MHALVNIGSGNYRTKNAMGICHLLDELHYRLPAGRGLQRTDVAA